VEFDPTQVSYAELLDVFWESHDPGYDPYLRQYRNAVFYLNEDQRQLAEESLITVKGSSRGEVSTVVEPAGEFYVAEDYHQKYLVRKAKGILQEYQTIYPDQDSLVASTAVARVNGYLGCNGQPEDVEKELTRLGLSRQMQELLVEHMSTSCDRFSGLTCPAQKRPQ
jgi:hypothetical protein